MQHVHVYHVAAAPTWVTIMGQYSIPLQLHIEIVQGQKHHRCPDTLISVSPNALPLALAVFRCPQRQNGIPPPHAPIGGKQVFKSDCVCQGFVTTSS